MGILQDASCRDGWPGLSSQSSQKPCSVLSLVSGHHTEIHRTHLSLWPRAGRGRPRCLGPERGVRAAFPAALNVYKVWVSFFHGVRITSSSLVVVRIRLLELRLLVTCELMTMSAPENSLPAACTARGPVAATQTPSGSYAELGGLQTYMTGRADARRAIVFLYDAFGLAPQTVWRSECTQTGC